MTKFFPCLLIATALAANAAGQEPTEQQKHAQALFEEGMSLMNDKRFGEACPKLEQSEELDPGMGTRFRLGECYEATGRIASAWALFLRVAEEAKRAGRTDREEESRQRADSLRPRLPGVVLAPPASEASVTLDGKPVARADLGTRIPIDPGEHTVRTTAPGHAPWEQKFTAVESKAVDVQLALGAGAAADVPAPSGMSPVRIAGIAIGALGVATVGGGLGAGAAARSAWDDALSQCQDRAVDKCGPAAIDRGKSAGTLATVSTALVIGGSVLAVGGIVMIIAAPKPKSTGLRLELVPTLGGAMFGGSF